MGKSPEKPPLSLVSPENLVISPPRPLGPPGRDLWDAVMREYAIRDRGGIEILAQLCAAQDRVESLRAAIDQDGETVHTKTGPRAHPALRDELQLRAFICRSLERLGLNIEPIRSPGRPPKLGW